MIDKTQQLKQLDQLEGFVRLMDTQFGVPGFRFGLDGIIGLVPGIGDFVGGLISLGLVLRMRQIGVPSECINKMIRNVLIDVIVGGVPILGDGFDFFFKVNERNLRIARRCLTVEV
jgi:hypothetical protein